MGNFIGRKRKGKFRLRAVFLDLATLGFFLATVAVFVYFVLIFLYPNSVINPFPPIKATTDLPTSTATYEWSPTPLTSTETATPEPTLVLTNTSEPPSATPEPTLEPPDTPTQEPTAVTFSERSWTFDQLRDFILLGGFPILIDPVYPDDDPLYAEFRMPRHFKTNDIPPNSDDMIEAYYAILFEDPFYTPDLLCAWLHKAIQNRHGFATFPLDYVMEFYGEKFGDPSIEPYCEEFDPQN